MKTYNNLWDTFKSQDNWKLAFKNARKHKTNRHYVKSFTEQELENLRRNIIKGMYSVSPYKEMTIYEPKKRIIYKAEFKDQIVQHAVMNILVPIFIPLFTNTCYACVPRKGTHSAVIKCSEYVRKYRYCLECDIHHFYPSVDQNILSSFLHKLIKDKKFMKIVDVIIFSFPGGKNIPIGNYTSQWFGNFYLSKLDNYIKHTLHMGKYIRYCDNFLIFSDNKYYLNYCKNKIELFLKNTLDLEYSKANVTNTSQGIDFCGYRCFKRYVLLRKRTAKRWFKKKITPKNIPSFYGITKHCCSRNLKIKILKKIPDEWEEKKLLISSII